MKVAWVWYTFLLTWAWIMAAEHPELLGLPLGIPTCMWLIWSVGRAFKYCYD